MTAYDAPYEDPRDDCDHDEFEVDLAGRADCSTCGHRWWLTNEQLARYDELQIELEEKQERERRCERSPFRRAWRAVKARIAHWLRDRSRDEIPF